jgi:hypothetical protein
MHAFGTRDKLPSRQERLEELPGSRTAQPRILVHQKLHGNQHHACVFARSRVHRLFAPAGIIDKLVMAGAAEGTIFVDGATTPGGA